MPNVDKHSPGSFSWVELATTDQSAAKKFYSSLFGWTVNDAPIGPGEIYTIFRIDGRDAAAGYTISAADRERGEPPHWNLYIATANADQTAVSAGDLGGTVLAPPFDVMDAGRMSVIQDPGGAIFCIWQANRNQGIGISGVEGTLCWADLNTPDTDGAKKFYEGLFGWTMTLGQNDSNGYLHIKNGEEFIGGAPPAAQRDPKIPPHWMVYFYVNDVDASAAKAKQLGGGIYMEPMTMENVGRMAVVADPQGAVFAIFSAAPRG
jgi:predicted enzyme related to lactoylglutathione lyase